jgi:hydroxylamine reductase
MNMFCNQCEQTARGKGCDTVGVCGKQADVAALQDIIVHQLKGIGFLADRARSAGRVDDSMNQYTIEALFSTVTNVDFDPDRLEDWIRKGSEIRDLIVNATGSGRSDDEVPESTMFHPAPTRGELLMQAKEIGLLAGPDSPDVRSLKQILLFGLKGMAAYADHARILGKTDPEVFAFFHEALSALNSGTLSVDDLVNLTMRCGKTNIRVMELLDEANTSHYGHPVPTPVSTAWRKGPAIVVTGHDLLDLEELLKQTEGKGINIYTHGEMLPAHGYPGLKKYKHLAGHFGTAWQNQQKEFDGVPAAFLFTTNCIQKPKESYIDRVFTCGLVAWPGVAHIKNRDFSPVIKKALALGGLSEKAGKNLLTGFGRNAVMSVAGTVIDGVKSGAIRRFFLIGGCDGAKPGRNYYTELAAQIPKDCVILTLACGKFRFNDQDFGNIGGIPRLLDIGQCNDAYSAVQIALALAKAFNCGVNDLPLSLVLSWYEQKAVVILLSLLSLGIKGIRIGPSLPAFISPGILDFLVKNFDLKPITTPEADLAAMLG